MTLVSPLLLSASSFQLVSCPEMSRKVILLTGLSRFSSFDSLSGCLAKFWKSLTLSAKVVLPAPIGGFLLG